MKVYDVLPDRGSYSFYQVMSCDLIFICLPTPMAEDGSCDTGYLVRFFESLGTEDRKRNMVIRSTVPIGFTRATTERMNCPNLVHSPEFLTARTATEDAANPRVNVIGHVGYEGYNRTNNPIYQVYDSRWDVPIRVMSSDESEAVKLLMNGFFATKVAYWNEVHALLQKKGCDYETVIETILAEGRVHPLHTKVPGPDGKMGFGGACLPKDLASLQHQLLEAECLASVTTAARFRNQLDRFGTDK